MDKEIFFTYCDHMLSLLSSYLKKEEKEFPPLEKEELAFYYQISKKHNIGSLLYKALSEYHLFIDEKSKKAFEAIYGQTLKKHILFERERNNLYSFMNEQGIDFLPLKGIIITPYYRDHFTREFADNDILFDPKRAKDIKKYFLSNGYSVDEYGHGPHDVYMKDPVLNFEMHRCLFDGGEDTKEFTSYFDTFLERAHYKDKHEKELTKEDFFLYFAAHTYKHYALSGCGIRTLVDFYLFLKKEKDLDMDYVLKEAEKLSLKDFISSFCSLSLHIFDREQLSDKEQESLEYILSSGTYGTVSNMVSNKVKKKGKIGYIFSRLFPPVSFYKVHYPWAYKSKIGIPIAWLIRLFRVIFLRHGKISNELKEVGKVEKE